MAQPPRRQGPVDISPRTLAAPRKLLFPEQFYLSLLIGSSCAPKHPGICSSETQLSLLHNCCLGHTSQNSQRPTWKSMGLLGFSSPLREMVQHSFSISAKGDSIKVISQYPYCSSPEPGYSCFPRPDHRIIASMV